MLSHFSVQPVFSAQVIKFSQYTRHEKTLRKSIKTPTAKGFWRDIESVDVTLISKPFRDCRVTEKTLSPRLTGDAHSLTQTRAPLFDPAAFATSIVDFPAMELRKRYKAEANCHRNMKGRLKAKGLSVHPAFESFRSFLCAVGPMPCPGCTLDRIDNDNPAYGPGLCRWADKRTQNSNKGDSLTFYYPPTNDTYTTSRLSKLQGVSPGTIRKRFERGWSDAEIVEGKRSRLPRSSSSNPQIAGKPSPHTFPEAPSPHACAPRPLSASEIYEERLREEYDVDELPAPLDDLKALDPVFGRITQEGYDRHYAKDWRTTFGRFMTADRFRKQPAATQAMIQRIDPAFVSKMEVQAIEKQALSEKL